MKYKYHLFTILFCVLSLKSISAEEISLQGKWRTMKSDGSHTILEFRSDGTLATTPVKKSGKIEVTTKYKLTTSENTTYLILTIVSPNGSHESKRKIVFLDNNQFELWQNEQVKQIYQRI